jgi:hypothetical protein
VFAGATVVIALAVLACAAGLLALAIPALNMRLGLPGDGSKPTSKNERRAYDLLAKGFGVGDNGQLTVVAKLPSKDASCRHRRSAQAHDTQRRDGGDQPRVVPHVDIGGTRVEHQPHPGQSLTSYPARPRSASGESVGPRLSSSALHFRPPGGTWLPSCDTTPP